MIKWPFYSCALTYPSYLWLEHVPESTLLTRPACLRKNYVNLREYKAREFWLVIPHTTV